MQSKQTFYRDLLLSCAGTIGKAETWLIYATLSELYLQAISDQSSLLIIMTCVL